MSVSPTEAVSGVRQAIAPIIAQADSMSKLADDALVLRQGDEPVQAARTIVEDARIALTQIRLGDTSEERLRQFAVERLTSGVSALDHVLTLGMGDLVHEARTPGIMRGLSIGLHSIEGAVREVRHADELLDFERSLQRLRLLEG